MPYVDMDTFKNAKYKKCTYLINPLCMHACRLINIVVVLLLDGLIIAATTTHNQTNRKFDQKLMKLALMHNAKNLGPL